MYLNTQIFLRDFQSASLARAPLNVWGKFLDTQSSRTKLNVFGMGIFKKHFKDNTWSLLTGFLKRIKIKYQLKTNM